MQLAVFPFCKHPDRIALMLKKLIKTRKKWQARKNKKKNLKAQSWIGKFFLAFFVFLQKIEALPVCRRN